MLRSPLHVVALAVTIVVLSPVTGSAQTALGDSWFTAAIGSPGVVGQASYQSCGVVCANFSITAGGTDIGGSSDQFRYAYRALNGDGTMLIRVGTLTATNSQSKAGIMIRESLDPGSRHGFIAVTPGAGVSYAHRLSTNGTTATVAAASGTVPQWLKIDRRGNTVLSYKSADGSTWTLLATDTLSLPRTVWIGAAVTSHDPYLSTTSSMTEGWVVPNLPSPWYSRDVGTPTMPGDSEYWSGVYTAYGSGSGLGATADQFRFTYRQAFGDGDLIVRVASLATVNTGTAAGVMIRSSLATNAAHMALLISSANGVQFQRRLLSGGTTVTTSIPGKVPGWVRIRRRSNLLTASFAPDNGVWTTVGQESIAMSSTFYVGMAATSRDTTKTSRTDLDTTALVPAAWIPAGTTVPPAVQLAAPGNGWTLTIGGSLNVAANAVDPDGVVTRVDFYVNGKLVGTDATAPYQVAWTPTTTGTYSIVAVATDDVGATKNSVASAGTVVAAAAAAAAAAPAPAYVTFTPSADDLTNVSYYYLRVYQSSVSLTTPVASLYLGKPAVVNGDCTVDISATMKALPSGTYVAVVSAINTGGETSNTPSSPFTN